MSIVFFYPRCGVASWEPTYRSESRAHGKSSDRHVSALTPVSSLFPTGSNTPRSRGLSKQPHISPASQGQANDTLPDGCQGSLSLRLALLRRSSTRFSRETNEWGDAAQQCVPLSGRRTVLAKTDRTYPKTAHTGLGTPAYSSRLSCFPNWFSEGEV
jgi:hypothetical protein